MIFVGYRAKKLKPPGLTSRIRYYPVVIPTKGSQFARQSIGLISKRRSFSCAV